MGDCAAYNNSTHVWTAKCDYSNDCGSLIAGQQGTSSVNYSNLVYTGSKTSSGCALNNMAAGISMDDYIKEMVENLWYSGQLKGCNEDVDGEVTVPPMRGFIEI